MLAILAFNREIKKEKGDDCGLKSMGWTKILWVKIVVTATKFWTCVLLELKVGYFLGPIEIPLNAYTQEDDFIEEGENMIFKITSVVFLKILLKYLKETYRHTAHSKIGGRQISYDDRRYR